MKISSGMQWNWWVLKDIANPVSRMTAAYNPLFTAPFCQHSSQTLSLWKYNFTELSANLKLSSACPVPAPSPHPTYQGFSSSWLLCVLTQDQTWSCCELWSSQEQMIFRQISSAQAVCDQNIIVRGGGVNMALEAEVRAGMPLSPLGSKLPWTCPPFKELLQNWFLLPVPPQSPFLPLMWSVLSGDLSMLGCRLMLQHLYFSTDNHNCSSGLCWIEGLWLHNTGMEGGFLSFWIFHSLTHVQLLIAMLSVSCLGFKLKAT